MNESWNENVAANEEFKWNTFISTWHSNAHKHTHSNSSHMLLLESTMKMDWNGMTRSMNSAIIFIDFRPKTLCIEAKFSGAQELTVGGACIGVLFQFLKFREGTSLRWPFCVREPFIPSFFLIFRRYWGFMSLFRWKWNGVGILTVSNGTAG